MKRSIELLIEKYKRNLEVVELSTYKKQYVQYIKLSNTIINDLEVLLKSLNE